MWKKKYLLSIVLFYKLIASVTSTNKTDCHDIAEVVLKVALNTITSIFDRRIRVYRTGISEYIRPAYKNM